MIENCFQNFYSSVCKHVWLLGTKIFICDSYKNLFSWYLKGFKYGTELHLNLLNNNKGTIITVLNVRNIRRNDNLEIHPFMIIIDRLFYDTVFDMCTDWFLLHWWLKALFGYLLIKYLNTYFECFSGEMSFGICCCQCFVLFICLW